MKTMKYWGMMIEVKEIKIVDTLVWNEEENHYIDENGNSVKLVEYENKNSTAIWSIRKVGSIFWDDFATNETIADIDMRLKSVHNPIEFKYGDLVNYNSATNDPDKTIWNKMCEWVKTHQEEVFDEYGDFKKEAYKFNFKEILKSMEEAENEQ